MDTHAFFFDYLKTLGMTSLTDEEILLFRDAFIPFRLKKRQCLLLAGDQCKNFAFIVKGAMRQYSIDEKGVEHMVRFGVEGWWMGDRESWVMGTPSVYCIDAWENTEMLLISRPKVLNLIKKSPLIVEVMRHLDERNNMASQRRLTSFISATAEKKYLDFLECYPDFVERFPQHIIASYLGITKDTLSRVKKKNFKK